MAKINIFIQFEGDNWEELWQLLTWFFLEKNLTFYIDETLTVFLKEPKKASLKRSTDRDDFLRKYQKHLKDWEIITKKGNYYNWNAAQNDDISNTNDLYCEIAERLFTHPEQKIILFEFGSGKKTTRYIIKDIYQERSEKIPALIKFDILKTEKDLWDWVETNREPRIFNYNPKHSRANSHAIEKNSEWVSPFLYAENEEGIKATNNLLKKAVQIDSSTLAAWDEAKNCYLIFKNDSKETNGTNAFSYHGFHLIGAANKKENEAGSKEIMTNDILSEKQQKFITKKFKP